MSERKRERELKRERERERKGEGVKKNIVEITVFCYGSELRYSGRDSSYGILLGTRPSRKRVTSVHYAKFCNHCIINVNVNG